MNEILFQDSLELYQAHTPDHSDRTTATFEDAPPIADITPTDYDAAPGDPANVLYQTLSPITAVPTSTNPGATAVLGPTTHAHAPAPPGEVVLFNDVDAAIVSSFLFSHDVPPSADKCHDVLFIATFTMTHTPTQARLGFCMDTGAPSSVVGRDVLHDFGLAENLTPSTKQFRFGDSKFRSLGKVVLYLETPTGIPPIPITFEVVTAKVPALIGLDVLDSQSLVVDTTTNRLWKQILVRSSNDADTHTVRLWWMPLRRHDGHVYAALHEPLSVYFSRADLTHMHRNFAHPSAEKLYKLLLLARPEDTTAETLKMLQDIARSCDPCQRIQNAPSRFRVSFGADNLCFNERIFLDVMYLDGLPVLHVIDEATHFSSARFLTNVSTKCIWQTFVECWSAIYIGLPNRVLVDQGTAFSATFANVAPFGNVAVERTGTEAHNSMGIGERYHHALRNTYRKVALAHPTSRNPTALL